MEVFEIIKRIEAENFKESETKICLILSKIYPILFTSSIANSQTEGENEIETFTKNFMKNCKGNNFSLEYLRLMQIVILAKSVYYNDDEDNNNNEEEEVDIFNNYSEKLGISLIEKDLKKKEIFSGFKEEGNELFNQFLRIQRDLKPSLLTGWINLLHPIVKTRPAFYPSLIPTLLSFTEPKWTESFSLIQKRNILHTLKAELTTLMSVPKAEKFYSLIMDSLDKCNVSSTTTLQASNNKKASEVPAEVEEDERELAASLGGIGQRTSGAFAEISTGMKPATGTSVTSDYESLASESLSKELIKIPSPMVNEMIVRMLGSWTLEQIKPVVLNRWNKINVAIEEPVDSTNINLKKTTEEAFTLEASQLTPELPGEIIHLSVSRILQSITDLSEFHTSSRRDDLIPSLEDEKDDGNTNGDAAGSAALDGSKVIGNVSRGIPVPLIPLCRIVALVAAHVGHVRSDILMDPEERRKKLDRQFDPRFRKRKTTEKDKDIFGSSDSEDDNVKMEVDPEDDDKGEFDKSVNQIVLGWINEDLPGRFDFVWYWLEAVWVREGKSGIISDSSEGDYDKLFDDVIGIVGEYFISEEEDAQVNEVPIPPGSLERVLKVLLKVPKLNASFIRNLLYPLMEESRYRRVALQSLAKLLLQRPALRAMLTDFVMTLAESEDAALRKDTIEILLLKGGLYPNLWSLSSQLEAYSLDLMDDLTAKQQAAAEEIEENAMKKLKLESVENLGEIAESEAPEIQDHLVDDFSDFEANTELFLGLLKRNPERLLPPLLVRFPRFGVKLQAFLLDRSLPQVVQNWSPKELNGLLKTLKNEQKVDEGGIVGELVIQIVKLVLSSSGTSSTEAESVDFYSEFAELIQTKIKSNTWDGKLIPDLIPWILRDRSDLPDFFNLYLPKLISTCPSEFISTANRICSSGGGQLISPTQLFVQIHLLPSSSVPLKNLIEVLQLIFNQCKISLSASKDQILFNVSVISSGLGQLVDQTPLPALLGRSLLQSIPLLNPSTPLNAPFLLSLLARLIPRKIWEAGKLWEGWIRCCRALLPASMSVLLQLPTLQLEKLLKEGGADLKAPLKEYLYNQPPSVRNRYTSILSAIEK